MMRYSLPSGRRNSLFLAPFTFSEELPHTNMKRKQDRGWLIALFGIVAGFLLGLWAGSQFLPSLSQNSISSLNDAQQDEYVALVAVNYTQSGDLAEAEAQLVALGAPNNGYLVAGVAEREINNGASPLELSALSQLAMDLGVQNSVLAAYLPTPTIEVQPSPTPAPPTPTPFPPTPTPVTQAATATPELPTPTPEAATPTPEPQDPTPTSEPATPTPLPAPAVVAVDTVNVRGGPDTIYPVVGSLAAGETAPLLGKDTSGAWWQILLSDSNEGWVYAQIVDTVGDVSGISVAANIPAPPATPTPSQPPTATPAPKPAVDFVVTGRRLWSPTENGGYFDGPSLHCGEKRELYAIVTDVNGQPLNGVTLLGIYSKAEGVTGSKGPGIAEWVLGGGDGLRVIRDVDGREVVSETIEGMTTDPRAISDGDFMASGFCTDAASCQYLRDNLACFGHYSWDVTFQRTY